MCYYDFVRRLRLRFGWFFFLSSIEKVQEHNYMYVVYFFCTAYDAVNALIAEENRNN